MALKDWFPGLGDTLDLLRGNAAAAPVTAPRAQTWYTNDPGIPGWFFGDAPSFSGVSVTRETALKIAVAWRCATIRTGVLANMPLDLYRRLDERRRVPAVGHPLRDVLTVKPNRWQTPSQFKRHLQLHKTLEGNGYAFKNMVGRDVRELIPLDSARMTVVQKDDLSLVFKYRTKNGSTVEFTQAQIFRIHGLSLDGISGLSVISAGREAMGLSIQAEKVSAKLFANGQFRSQVYQKKEGSLSDEAYLRLKNDLAGMRGADNEDAGGAILLEDGLEVAKPAFSAEDLQFLGLRDLSRSEVGMFFGVPPFLYGDTEKSTSWGTGIGQMNIAFLQYAVQDDITDWEEAIKRDCLADSEPSLYAKFDTKGFLRMDAAERREWNKAALGHGGGQAFETLNEVRAVEEFPPIEEDWANTIGQAVQQTPSPAPVEKKQ